MGGAERGTNLPITGLVVPSEPSGPPAAGDTNVEVGVHGGNDPAEIGPGTARKPQQHIFQKVPRHQGIAALTARLRIRKNAPGPEIPPALGEGGSYGPRPQPFPRMPNTEEDTFD